MNIKAFPTTRPLRVADPDDPGFRTGTRGWDHPMGESDQLVRTQKLKEVGKSDDFPEFKKVIRWKIPS